MLLAGAAEQFGDWIPGRYNWEGKLIATTVWLVVIVTVFRNRLAAVGLTLKQNGPFPITAYALAVFCATSWALACIFKFSGVNTAPLTDIAYQLTMPSLEEELWFRGVLLAMLIEGFTPKAADKPRPSALILAVLVTSLSFWGAHSISPNGDGGIVFNVWARIDTLGFGLIWVIVRLGTGSIALPLALHTWANTASYIL